MMSGAFAKGIGGSELTLCNGANQRRNFGHRRNRGRTREAKRSAERSHSGTGWSITQNYCTEICVQWPKEEAPPSHCGRQEAAFRNDEAALGNWGVEGAKEEEFQEAHHVCGSESKDFQGSQEAMGKGESTVKESGGVNIMGPS
jgi:hypothetical protein